MENFPIIVNKEKPLIIIAKRSILDAGGSSGNTSYILDPTYFKECLRITTSEMTEPSQSGTLQLLTYFMPLVSFYTSRKRQKISNMNGLTKNHLTGYNMMTLLNFIWLRVI